MYITNISRAPRGLTLASGQYIEIKPGESRVVELSERDQEVVSLRPKVWRVGDQMSAPTLDQLNDDVSTDESEEISRLVEENSRLRARIAELEGTLGQDSEDEDIPDLEAKHRGGGSYSVVTTDGTELVEGLDKAQAGEFNAMDDAAKNQYVRDSRSQSGE